MYFALTSTNFWIYVKCFLYLFLTLYAGNTTTCGTLAWGKTTRVIKNKKILQNAWDDIVLLSVTRDRLSFCTRHPPMLLGNAPVFFVNAEVRVSTKFCFEKFLNEKHCATNHIYAQVKQFISELEFYTFAAFIWSPPTRVQVICV